jgi:hypothetical protein
VNALSDLYNWLEKQNEEDIDVYANSLVKNNVGMMNPKNDMNVRRGYAAAFGSISRKYIKSNWRDVIECLFSVLDAPVQYYALILGCS